MESINKEDPKPINRLILVGNGFDLAHGMKTSYSDFILWYFSKCWEEAKETHVRSSQFPNENIYINDLITFSYESYTVFYSNPLKKWEITEIEHLKSLVNQNIDSSQRKVVNLTINSQFLISIVDDVCNKNWVNIENHYYYQLTQIIKRQSLNESQNEQSFINEINTLNLDFGSIKKSLEEYLSTLSCPIENELTIDYMYEFPLDSPKEKNLELENLFIVNFNYTKTTQRYWRNKTSIIHIHGQVSNPDNPIIFGYGDERDETYELLEKANIPEVFTHIKSFDYLKTDNYSRLLAFLESPYDVYIMGHSCGLSDRTLLSTIFEHENCRFIKIFYHDNAENYRKTTYEISRHFKDKAEMRRKVLNFEACKPMPQSKPDVES